MRLLVFDGYTFLRYNTDVELSTSCPIGVAMENKPRNLNQILSSHISGFHQYCLEGVARPIYISRNLCDMLALSEEELLSERTDLYAEQVHPADRKQYNHFLKALGGKEQTATLQYRLLKKDGSTLYVNDTMVSYLLDGHMVGDSVLTDITQIKMEKQNLQFLNDTMPWGFIKYTCEKSPRATYVNDQMLKILGFPEGSDGQFDDLGLYMSNIYTMIPADERGRFARYLERVYEQGAPLAGEMTALRRDGTRIRIWGWVTKCINESGEEEFQSAFMDITERYRQRKDHETSRYLKALTEVYDKIFEYDLVGHTVKCLYGQHSTAFQQLENIPMQMEDATEKWITNSAEEQDRDRLRSFFRKFFQRKLREMDGRPPQITYRAMSSAGSYQTYTGIFLKMDRDVSLYCCHRTPEPLETSPIQELAMRFTEGVVAFEVENDKVKPMYISENVCSFFGYSREAWISLAEKRPTIREFIAMSGVDYADVKTLFATGEAEFTYFDMEQNAYRRIRAICSQKYNGEGTCYVMLYNLDAKEPEDPVSRVRIRTFGYFDVFVDERPIAFRNEKSKELLALLVDRRGGFVSSDEAIGFLWENEPVTSVTLARYRKVALRLKNLLEEYGISDVVESINGKRRLAAEKVQCDLYEYLSGKKEYAALFKGSYLTNYSWGETTLAELTGDHLYSMGE